MNKQQLWNKDWRKFRSLELFYHSDVLRGLVYLYNLKNVENTHGRVLFLVKLQASAYNLLKVKLLHECFSCFLNCANGTKLRNASHIHIHIYNLVKYLCWKFFLKQSSRCVLRKKCSENMLQIHRRTPVPFCDFIIVALQLY